MFCRAFPCKGSLLWSVILRIPPSLIHSDWGSTRHATPCKDKSIRMLCSGKLLLCRRGNDNLCCLSPHQPPPRETDPCCCDNTLAESVFEDLDGSCHFWFDQMTPNTTHNTYTDQLKTNNENLYGILDIYDRPCIFHTCPQVPNFSRFCSTIFELMAILRQVQGITTIW